jgi:hypothetical protein
MMRFILVFSACCMIMSYWSTELFQEFSISHVDNERLGMLTRFRMSNI